MHEIDFEAEIKIVMFRHKLKRNFVFVFTSVLECMLHIKQYLVDNWLQAAA
jgi:hypothetical protein